MSKNIDHVQHIKSNVVVEGKPKLPQPSALMDGELAVNYATGFETISIRNASGDVVAFSSDEYYTKQKLGSGFTGENSANTVTSVIESNERVTAAALNDLKENKLDASAYTPTDLSDYYTKEETDARDLWVSGTGENAIAQKGGNNIASGNYSVAEGYHTSAVTNSAHVEGQQTMASGHSAHAEGIGTIAGGHYSHAEGTGTTTVGNYSHAEGDSTTASGNASHAEGNGTSATSQSSHAEGAGTTASGVCSHAEGGYTNAYGYYSHAEGRRTSAFTQNSHAEGDSTTASGNASHAEGYGTSATSYASHAEGYGTLASGSSSHAEGESTITLNSYEHASGKHNVSNYATPTFGDSGNTLFSVGNGTSNNTRHNAFEIRQNGDIYIVSGNTDIKLQDNLGGNIDIDQTIDSGTSASTNAVSTSAVYGFVTSYTPSITVDQVLDDTTSASTNPVSSKAVYDAVTDNELVWTNAYVTLSGAVSSHTANNDIHVTAADKTNWNSVSGYADSVKYNETNHYMEFYHGTTAGTKVYEFDASDFIIDGMVEDVRIEEVAGSGTCLVIDFNTASGKQDINIPISDIFDANNYYTKTEVDSALSGKVNTSDVISAITSENSGSTNPIATKVIAENELVIATALNDLNVRKLDASAYTPTDLSNYYTKSETSGATEISDALSGKVDTSTFDTIVGSGYTSSSITEIMENMDITIAAAITDLDGRKADTSVVTSAISDALSALTLASSAVTSMAGYAMAASGTPITSADTLNEAIGKLEKMIDEFKDYIEQKELAIAAAITDLNDKVGDIESILATI